MSDISLNSINVDVVDETFKGMLQRYIDNPDGKIPLTVIIKRMVIAITNVPTDSLGRIEKLILKIFDDEKLDVQDTPIVMILLQELYELYSALEFERLKAESCASLLKIMTHVIYVNKFSGKFSEDESVVLLRTFYSVIDTSVMLMDLKEVIPKIKKSKWCCM